MSRSLRVLRLFVFISFLSVLVPTRVMAGSSLDASAIFLEARTFGTGGNGAISLAVADVNGDGRLDVVIANECVTGSVCTNAAGSVGVLLGNSDGTFQSAVSYFSNGNSTSSVAVTDVNGDGKPDLLVASACANGGDCTAGTISVLRGNGDGTFQAAVSYASGGEYTTSLAAADVNGDGKIDLLVANQCLSSSCTSGGVAVLLGNGDGTFRPAVIYNSGGLYAYSLAVKDVNGDGKADLLVANELEMGSSPDGGVGVLLGMGDGTFQPAVSYPSGGQNAKSISVADVNGDGKPDLVVANSYIGGSPNDGGVGVLLGNGNGTFQKTTSYASGGNNANWVAVADVNGDGHPDLVVAHDAEGSANSNGSNGTLGVLMGNGDGTFKGAVHYVTGGLGATSLAVADVNGDGKPDLLVTTDYPANGGGALSELLGNGDGTFEAGTIYPSGGRFDESVAAGDVNGDGKLDLIVANLCVSSTNCLPGAVGVLLGNGDGTFRSPTSYSSGGYEAASLAVADVNGDGTLDLLVANECVDTSCTSGALAVLLGNGDGTFQAPVTYASGGKYAYSVAVGDVNRDGKPDLLVANQCLSSNNCTNGTVGVLLGLGNGTFRAAVTYGSGGQYSDSLAIADVNGDGKADLLVANYYAGNGNSNGSLGVLLGNGDGTFQVALSYPSGGLGANSVAVADVNGDGKPDLLAANGCVNSKCAAGALGVLLGNGDGTFQPVLPAVTPVLNVNYFATLAVADFNGDGKQDIACGAGDYLLLGNGDGSFQTPLLLGAAGIGIAAGDFDRDGKPDIAVGGVIIFLNGSLWTNHTTSTALDSSSSLSSYGALVTFTATVTPQGSGTPTGSITFADGSTTLGTVPLTNGTAAFGSSLLVPGVHGIIASYGGDTNFASSKSSSLTQTVTKAATTTTLSSSVNPSYVNQVVTFTATVTSQNRGAVTGQVTFKQGASTLGAVSPTNGHASFSTSYATAGGRSINAVYSGDSNNLSSTSAALSQAVKSLPASTTAKVTTSGSPTFINRPVTFTVTVTSTYGPIPDGETMTFYDGAVAMGTGSTAHGVVSLTTSSLAAKTHTIKATYSGDATFLASSGTVTQVVSLYPSSTNLPSSSLNPSIYGQSVTLTAKVTSNAPSGPTGTVTFKNGATTLGSGTLNASGVATLIKANLPAGSLSVTATYNGDPETARSTSVPLSQIVNQATSATTLKSSVNPSLSGQSVIFTATVTSATTVPTGSVTFLDSATVLGTATLAGGKANFSTTTLSAGSHSITATYAGTANIKGSGSSPIVQIVN